MTKAEIVLTAMEGGVPLELTWTCYEPQPDGAACGRCDACQLRHRGFADAGLADLLLYARDYGVRCRRSSARRASCLILIPVG